MLYNQHNTNNRDYFVSKPESRPCKKPELKIWLECGINPQDAIFEIDDGSVRENQTFPLNQVIVDAAHLCNPIVKIEFSSIIFFEAEDERGDEKLVLPGHL